MQSTLLKSTRGTRAMAAPASALEPQCYSERAATNLNGLWRCTLLCESIEAYIRSDLDFKEHPENAKIIDGRSITDTKHY
jgi:hypothetical protein